MAIKNWLGMGRKKSRRSHKGSEGRPHRASERTEAAPPVAIKSEGELYNEALAVLREAVVRKDLPESVRHAEALRARFPQVAEGYQIGVEALRESKRWDELEVLLDEALTRFPNEAWPLAERTRAAAARCDWEEAILRAEQFRARFPAIPAGYPYAALAPLETAQTTMESDRDNFFKTIFNQNLSVEEVVRAYLQYHGPIFNDQRRRIRERLDSDFARLHLDLRADQLFDGEDMLNVQLLSGSFPLLGSSYYYDKADAELAATTLLPASINECLYQALPRSIAQRSHNPNRPPFIAYRVKEHGSLFVGPYQYQLFDERRGVMFPQVASRPFDRSIERYARIQVNRPAFLVQDPGDGTNFAHFLFDWITRVMHSVTAGIAVPGEAVFIMGGRRTGLHDLILSALNSRYSVDKESFLFPDRRQILDLSDDLTFFSDSQLVRMHPAQMAHPRSIELLRDLCDSVAVPPSRHELLYISRRDAKLRKVVNEESLIEIAQRRGFEVVDMSAHPIEQQISMVKGARVVAGPHGMGLTHIIFNPGPLTVVELFHPTIGTDAFAMISRSLGFTHHFLIGTDEADNRASYKIDPSEFSRMLDRVV